MLNSSRKGRIRRGLKEVIGNMESTINICYYCCFHWSKFLRKKWRREVAGLGKIKKRGGKKSFYVAYIQLPTMCQCCWQVLKKWGSSS